MAADGTRWAHSQGQALHTLLPSPTRLITQVRKLRLKDQSCRWNWDLNQAHVALESVLFFLLGC